MIRRLVFIFSEKSAFAMRTDLSSFFFPWHWYDRCLSVFQDTKGSDNRTLPTCTEEYDAHQRPSDFYRRRRIRGSRWD